MSPAGFEPATPTSERLQTYILDRAVTDVLQIQWANFSAMLFISVSYYSPQTARRSPRGLGAVVSGAVRGTAGYREAYWTAIGRNDRQLCYYTDWEHQVFRVACSDRVHCANAFRMGSNNSSLTTRSYACASIAFLAGIMSWSVDSILQRHRTSNIDGCENFKFAIQ
jgi:hypothetical protein